MREVDLGKTVTVEDDFIRIEDRYPESSQTLSFGCYLMLAVPALLVSLYNFVTFDPLSIMYLGLPSLLIGGFCLWVGLKRRNRSDRGISYFVHRIEGATSGIIYEGGEVKTRHHLDVDDIQQVCVSATRSSPPSRRIISWCIDIIGNDRYTVNFDSRKNREEAVDLAQQAADILGVAVEVIE